MTERELYYLDRISRGLYSDKFKRVMIELNRWGNEEPEPAKATEIARRAKVTRAFVHILLKPLEKLGYIEVVRYRNGAASRTGCILVHDWYGLPAEKLTR